eukprot:gb/GECG01013413.1/.p1 GENE.gb/GECG01013413.1/~~gb/GECG01013413.1/.p1  ORF type:complete len:101 (+),score=12.62 gb/GECG01013413.1/:1-303(+)
MAVQLLHLYTSTIPAFPSFSSWVSGADPPIATVFPSQELQLGEFTHLKKEVLNQRVISFSKRKRKKSGYMLTVSRPGVYPIISASSPSCKRSERKDEARW